MLRKPLNIQDGKEDGHQGGRRYGPMDEGYQILKQWVERQPEVQRPAGEHSNNNSAPLSLAPALPAIALTFRGRSSRRKRLRR
jgi:hypothetical protein